MGLLVTIRLELILGGTVVSGSVEGEVENTGIIKVVRVLVESTSALLLETVDT